MGRFNKLETLNCIKKTKVVPVFYDPSLEVTIEVASACYKGGIKILEFTNRGDLAWEVFKELEKYCKENLPEMVLGAGSISASDISEAMVLETHRRASVAGLDMSKLTFNTSDLENLKGNFHTGRSLPKMQIRPGGHDNTRNLDMLCGAFWFDCTEGSLW